MCREEVGVGWRWGGGGGGVEVGVEVGWRCGRRFTPGAVGRISLVPPEWREAA